MKCHATHADEREWGALDCVTVKGNRHKNVLVSLRTACLGAGRSGVLCNKHIIHEQYLISYYCKCESL